MNNKPRYRAVWRVVAGIPAGRVMSYGGVARAAGLGRAARFVSIALRAAPAGLELPWHRVVAANGRIAFPPGSKEFQQQHGLLEMEGVRFRKGRIGRAQFSEPDPLDKLIWGEPSIRQGEY